MRLAAQRHDIDPLRLIFAPLLAHGEHLGRYQLADLFLDTSPYNAHTTASDALRSCLPLITLRGTTFAGRVSESLLKAVGVPELVADDIDSYEAMALQLAANPGFLQELRRKISSGIAHGPLFDTYRLARKIEAAYAKMHSLAFTGRSPVSFAVMSDGAVTIQG